MYKIISLTTLEDYFNPISKRTSCGIYFYRFIGYDDNILNFLKRYLKETSNRGYYFKNTISNPSETDIKLFNFRTNSNFSFSLSYIKDITNGMLDFLSKEKIDLLSQSIFDVLTELNKKGANVNILKNAAIKFICWLNSFKQILKYIGDDVPPKILYEGNISKYEVYFLIILAKCGCDIVYVNFESEESFIKHDKSFSNVIYGKNKGKLSLALSDINATSIENREHLEKVIQDNQPVDYLINSWIQDDFLEVLFKKNNIRAISSGNVSKIHTMFIQCLGIDDITLYNNRLYSLYKDLEKSNKPFILFDNKIDNPTMDEVSSIKRFNYSNKDELLNGLLMNIGDNFSKSLKDNIAKSLYLNLVKDSNLPLPKLYNIGIKCLCWLKRINNLFSTESDILPLVLYYGECNDSEAIFLNILGMLPLDVLYFCPKRDTNTLVKAQKVELQNSMDISSYPKTEMKYKAATTAYSAERELDTTLYTDTGLYRDQQFAKVNSVTLKTTYEEIAILWREESKFRPSFKTDANKVYVPNIFAKINGVKDGDVNKYVKNLRSLVTSNTLYFYKFNFLDIQSTLDWSTIQKFVKGNTIDFNKLKNLKEYKYQYLSDNTQNLILDKIQELINLNWLKTDSSINIYYVLINTLLNLDKKTLMLIQQFDFTKEIPKVIVTNIDESMPDIKDCIYLLFLNLVGFDIVVFTPTGYKNIEKYIKEEVFENHIIGEYMFNVKIPYLYTPTKDKNSSGFFSRLFRS